MLLWSNVALLLITVSRWILSLGLLVMLVGELAVFVGVQWYPLTFDNGAALLFLACLCVFICSLINLALGVSERRRAGRQIFVS